jgi:hypothetical protein
VTSAVFIYSTDSRGFTSDIIATPADNEERGVPTRAVEVPLDFSNFEFSRRGAAVEVPAMRQAACCRGANQHYSLPAASAGVIFYSRDSTAFTSAVTLDF